jgi:tRNA1(Val) A37 N6-methylase TrmN6
MDAVLLSAFLSPSKIAFVCDLGSGGGAVTMLIAARYPEAVIDGVEIQPEAAALLGDNIRLNGLENRVRAINADLKALDGAVPAGKYSAVVCNPPYFQPGRGKQAESRERAVERSETAADMRDVCRESARLLKNGGELAMVCRSERLCDIIMCMREAGIEPKRLKYVQHTPHSAPKLMLISGRRSASPGIKTESPLFICGEDGSFTDEYKRAYGGQAL